MSLIFSLKEGEVGYQTSSIPFLNWKHILLVHNFNMKEQIFQKRPTPVSLKACMGSMLINFPKSLYDVEYRDEWPLQMYIEYLNTSSKQQLYEQVSSSPINTVENRTDLTSVLV
jgi:hypothetical protein